ncbi:MAG: hypothetical protein LBR43_01800 [Spiroplasmataceae bacterium]|nr:hypothetical protein [Spiroplasmataceae bacterium]
MKSNYLTWEKGTFLTEWGYLIKLEMKLMKLSEPVSWEFPEGYKFRWIVYNIENPDELIRIDNHTGKSLHLHIDKNREVEFLPWISLQETRKLFFGRVYQRFGYFDYD